MKKLITIFVFAAFSGLVFAQSAWQSALVSVSSEGRITYHPDADGFVLPDFSHAGYKGGGIELPEVPTVKTIEAIEGDNTQHIQDAINEVGALTKDANGIRGAVLLKAGKYEIYGTILVNYDGVVLRGEGQGDDENTSTILYARGNTPAQRDVVKMGNTSQINGKTVINGTKSFITDAIVPVGSFTFHVQYPELYKVDDRIIIHHPCTQLWVNAVDQGGVPYPDPSAPTDPDERWVANQLPIVYNRFITAINGTEITIDAPVFYTLNTSVSPCEIYKPNMTELIQQVGLENLRIDIETLGGEDEDHAWEAVRFKSCESSWAKNCTFIHFGHSGIMTEACTISTFTDCSAIDPIAIITGERMYNFNTYVYSQLNLFKNCYARGGRHHYVSNGTSSTSGNVFLRCTSDAINSVSEGHRQWTQGMLYDNHKEINLKRDFVLGLYNRVAMGTGHGWATANSVLWNCDVDASSGIIGLQKPPTSQNYAIGCKAKTITGTPISNSSFEIGYVEGQNKAGLYPESLYEAQLSDRMLNTKVKTTKADQKLSLNISIVDNVLKIWVPEKYKIAVLQLQTLDGKLLKSFQMDSNNCTISIQNIENGFYVLTCFSNGEIAAEKFLKN